MLPMQILLVNLVTDIPLISIATDMIDPEELKRPKAYSLKEVVWLIVLLGVISSVFDFLFFWIFRTSPPSLMRTLWFVESSLTEIVLIFSIRTRRWFWQASPPSLPLAGLALVSTLLILVLPFSNLGKQFFFFVSPPFFSLLLVFLLVFLYFFISEVVKVGYFRVKNKDRIFFLNRGK